MSLALLNVHVDPRRLRDALRMVTAGTEVAAPAAVGPSPIGGPLRVGMFGGGTVGGGVYEICEQVGRTLIKIMLHTNTIYVYVLTHCAHNLTHACIHVKIIMWVVAACRAPRILSCGVIIPVYIARAKYETCREGIWVMCVRPREWVGTLGFGGGASGGGGGVVVDLCLLLLCLCVALSRCRRRSWANKEMHLLSY